MDRRRSIELVNITDPHEVMKESEIITGMMFPHFRFAPVRNVFHDIVKLFNGKYPGYRECNTEYHDLRHTTDTVLAMVRLMHGALVDGQKISERSTNLGLLSALMHDTGYIQTTDDTKGTGAKYTLVHVQRSVDFMKKYLTGHGYTADDFDLARNVLLCTGLVATVKDINFQTEETELLGKMLGTADLMGQMADWAYLEKLLFLFYEFKEANINEYKQELDILKKTLDFYKSTQERFRDEFGGVDKYMRSHFQERWQVNENVYQESIEKNMQYVGDLMKEHEKDYRHHLRRAGIVQKIRKQHGD